MKKILVVLCVCFIASSAYAGSQAFQASLTPGIAIHSSGTHIEGVALSVWGQNPQSALALGFINGSTGNSKGFSWGLVNYAENYTGVELSFVNYAHAFTGLQLGFINYTSKLKGLQLGTVNFAETAESGLQVGFVNIIPQNEWFSGLPNELAKGMIFVNWRF